MNTLNYRRKLVYNTIINQKRIEEISTIFSGFQRKYAIIKGIPLSYLAYNDINYRTSADIDVLIHRNDLCEIEKRLIDHGYTPDNMVKNTQLQRESKIIFLTSSHQINSYSKVVDGINVTFDLNFDIFWGEYTGKRIDMVEFISDTIEINAAGIMFKTLSPIKAMIQLILHHYKDMNSIYLLAVRSSINLEMFRDIYALLKNNSKEITISRLYSLGKKYEIVPYIFYMLYYTRQIYDDVILNSYIEKFRTVEGEYLLDRYGLSENERKIWLYDFATRIKSDNIFNLIKNDLTVKDYQKIQINKSIFSAGSK